MEGKKFSLKAVINQSIASMRGNCSKIFASMTLQYVAFLLVYFFTHSFLISFVVYGLFLPSQVKFLKQVQNGSKFEDVFRIGKNFVTALVISMLFMFIFGVGLALLIFPGIIFFANYALVFDIAGENSGDALASLKLAKSRVKGYRGKMAWLAIIFLFIAILMIGLGMLFAWLFSLFIPTLTVNSSFVFSFLTLPLFCYVGLLVGLTMFLIFVLPIQLIAISNMYGAIEQDKLYNASKQEEPQNAGEVAEKIDQKDVEVKEPKSADKPDDRDEGDPTDLIF